MAYGLHTIAHKNYVPDGSGRDWFFIGDYEYRNGCKTPVGQSAGKRPTRPPGQKRGAPSEVAFHKRVLAGSGRAKTLERWQLIQEENVAGCSPQQRLAHSASRAAGPGDPGKGGALAATSWQLGRHPAWRGTKYELSAGTELEMAGAIRSASAPTLEPGPGDHTRGIRGSNPHFVAESWKLGGDPVAAGRRFGLATGAELEGAGAIRGPPRPGGEPGPGDHTLGVRGAAPHFTSDYHRLGQIPGWRHPKRGAPLKHAFHSVPCYPDDGPRGGPPGDVGAGGAGVAGAAGAGDGAIPGSPCGEGDHTRGIRGSKPHFTSTYDDHGQIPGWQGSRFDFGPLANSRLRLTEWGRSEA